MIVKCISVFIRRLKLARDESRYESR